MQAPRLPLPLRKYPMFEPTDYCMCTSAFTVRVCLLSNKAHRWSEQIGLCRAWCFFFVFTLRGPEVWAVYFKHPRTHIAKTAT
jgi:hypothetical protein